MTAQRNPDRLIGAFLEEGQVELPERVFNVVRRDIHRTRQRVVIGPWREPSVTTLTRLAIAAAVAVAVGVAWLNFGPPPGNVGGPPTPEPTVLPTASPALVSGPNRELDPGPYYFDYGLAANSSGFRGGTIVAITIPDEGWTNYQSFAVDRNYGASDEEAGASLVMWNITNRYVDGCGDPTELDPAPGAGIDELLEALADQPGIDAGPISDVTVDGFAGRLIELTVTVDIATCPDGFYPWLDKFVQGNDEVLRVYALDVEGGRFTFFARIPARTTPEDRTRLEALIASIDIEP